MPVRNADNLIDSRLLPTIVHLLPLLHQRDGSDRSETAPEQYMPSDRRQ